MAIMNNLLRIVPGFAAVLATAAVAQAQTATDMTAASLAAGDRIEARAAIWDAVAEKKKSPYYEMAAYLALKPFTQVGNHDEVPALLANGKCSDPAGEGR